MDQGPSEYIPPKTRKVFTYANGNTFDPATALVTEAQGAKLQNNAYLNEPAATNIIPNSHIASSKWIVAGATVIVDDAGPAILFGLPSARIESASAISAYSPMVVDNATDYVFSCHLKKAASSVVRMTIGNNLQHVRVEYNFDTGSIEGSTAGNAILTGYGAEEGHNGSVRLWVSGRNVSANGTQANTIISASESENSVYADGAQFEVGRFPTSYIPTAGAAVTRAADYLQYSNVGVNGEFTAAFDLTPLASTSEGYDGVDVSLFGSNNPAPIVQAGGFSLNLTTGGANIPVNTAEDWIGTLETGKRRRYTWTIDQQGADIEYIGYVDGQRGDTLPGAGAGNYYRVVPNVTLNHSSSNQWRVGSRYAPGHTLGLIHRFALFDTVVPVSDALRLSGGQFPAWEDS
jgi:hypothetical protein